MSSDRIAAKEKDYLYLADSQLANAGQGLFVSIPIYKDEIISVFKGEKLTPSEAARRASKKEDAYFINCMDGSILDSKHTACFAKYANDPAAKGPGILKNNFKSNADISMDDEDNICLIATRNIKSGEEVFCNYGKKYWKKFSPVKPY